MTGPAARPGPFGKDTFINPERAGFPLWLPEKGVMVWNSAGYDWILYATLAALLDVVALTSASRQYNCFPLVTL